MQIQYIYGVITQIRHWLVLGWNLKDIFTITALFLCWCSCAESNEARQALLDGSSTIMSQL